MKAQPNILNPRQEEFCKLYTSDRELFGNGVESYTRVYKINKDKASWYKTACVNASRLLSNAKVTERINQLLERNGLNNSFVDKQLNFLITQNVDFGIKLGAIREYNKIRQRIVKKIDRTSQGRPVL